MNFGRGKDSSFCEQKEAKNFQVARFRETARALGCDEDEAAFDEKLKRIVKQKLSSKPEKVPTGG
jgi:hypothetical protein